jgi:hypothetical protein
MDSGNEAEAKTALSCGDKLTTNCCIHFFEIANLLLQIITVFIRDVTVD